MLTKQFVESQVVLHTLRGEVIINCPQCDDTKGHCYCNLTKMVYCCHKCDARGKIVDTDIDIDSRLIYRYKKSLDLGPSLRYKGLKYEFNESAAIDPPKEKEVFNLPLCKSIQIKAVDYLRERGFYTSDFPTHLFEGTEGKYKGMIIFPILNPNSMKPKFFVARRYDNSPGPRFINAPWPKKDTLYFCTPHQHSGIMFITEGIFDAVAVAKAGYNAISILGKRATTDQLERITREFGNNYKAVILMDRDAFGNAVKLKIELHNMGTSFASILTLTDGKDPADIMKEEGVAKLKEILDAHTSQH